MRSQDSWTVEPIARAEVSWRITESAEFLCRRVEGRNRRNLPIHSDGLINYGARLIEYDGGLIEYDGGLIEYGGGLIECDDRLIENDARLDLMAA
jgi:hypothetical protein